MKSRDKSVLVVIAFVAVIAAVGWTTFNRYETRKEVPKEETYVTHTDAVEAEIEVPQEISQDITEPVSSEEPQAEIIQEKPKEAPEELTFSAEETLMWPVDGNVILNYSMDQTIYFATLEQYKYNPALVISGELGGPVLAAADGEVRIIGKDARVGNTITVDIGSGYETVYGQLQEIRVAEGERVKKGDVIGYIEEPTKYYSVEGSNLYFQLLKNGEPENPLEYMEE